MGDKGRAGRDPLTAAGNVRIQRLYLACPRCGQTRYPLDDRLGVRGFVSPGARKLLCLAGAGRSFAGAAEHLAPFCGLRTCDRTVRKVCFEEAGLLADWLHGDKATGQAFAQAGGDIEFQADGTMANSREGWREVRRGAFAQRHPGRPAPADRWDRRRLPRPHAGALFAAIEAAERFGPRIRRWAARLGLRDPSAVTVPGDGADRIWRQAGQQSPGAPGLLDISHALEHIWACARAVYGEGSEPARRRAEQARAAPLRGGGPAPAEHIEAARRGVRPPAKRQALARLAGYFARQADHLGYAARLALGQSIGGGLVEGACEQVIGKRRKQTGARWRIRRANRMAALCCTLHGDTWDPYWQHRLN